MFTKKEINEAKELAKELEKEGLPEKTIQTAAKASLMTAKYRREETPKQKAMSEESKRIGQVICYINKDWKKRWIPFIKYDGDWDFAFIDTLIAHKLKLMKEFYSNSKNVMMDSKCRRTIVKQIDKVLSLYNDYFMNNHNIEEERKTRLKFYHKLALLSFRWWD